MNSQHDDLLLPGENDDPSRRAFLKLAGFGVTSAALAGCSRAPQSRVLAPLAASAGTTPGVPYEIATTCDGCSAGCGVLARCRDGRPLKLEGNPEHGLSRGGLCAVGQGEILSLYDSMRLSGPRAGGEPRTWAAADAALLAQLEAVRGRSGSVRILTGTQTSIPTRLALESFLATQPDARHVEIDALSNTAVIDAHERTHGARVAPRVHLDRARVIASFGADFLGTGPSPVEHAAAWVQGRRPETGGMSRHWQFEPLLSLTGGVADQRRRLAPHETVPALAALVDLLELREPAQDAPQREALAALAGELLEASGEALVLCGVNDLDAQLLANRANELCGAYGATLDVARPSYQRMGDDVAARELARELEADSVDVLVVAGTNPAYARPDLGPLLRRAKLLISCAPTLDETAALADWVLPEPHRLERWDVCEPVHGQWSLSQPTVPPLFDARSLAVTLVRWSGDDRDERALTEDALRSAVHPRVDGSTAFDTFLVEALRTGFVAAPDDALPQPAFQAMRVTHAPLAPEGLALVLYQKVGLRDGGSAYNPWLQELPDPISHITWDNYATLSPQRAAQLEVSEGQIVRVRCADFEEPLELPAHIQPGQHDDVVGVALGYGRAGTDRFAGVAPRWLEGEPTIALGEVLGVNAAPWLALRRSHSRTDVRSVTIEPTGAHRALAASQDYDRLALPPHLAPKGHEVRDVLQRKTLTELEHPEHDHPAHHAGPGLWPADDHERAGHAWGMTIDLTACTGCGACVVGCQAENNVPVVGRDEVRRHRELHWLRIDRYFSGDGDDLRVSHQPMMCQHCDNAPCEAVCPVLATVHSSEGLNQQVYNRCVGTRYCANTCPYKVRRFNWFNYPHEDELANHALNPDVAVRTRGVMEKCSMCAQRIQAAKAAARQSGEPIVDGDLQTACQQSCPTQAIVFGDLSDPASAVTHSTNATRAYHALEELNVRPSVAYLSEVRNAAEDSDG